MSSKTRGKNGREKSGSSFALENGDRRLPCEEEGNQPHAGPLTRHQGVQYIGTCFRRRRQVMTEGKKAGFPTLSTSSWFLEIPPPSPKALCRDEVGLMRQPQDEKSVRLNGSGSRTLPVSQDLILFPHNPGYLSALYLLYQYAVCVVPRQAHCPGIPSEPRIGESRRTYCMLMSPCGV
ncbi:hypothetical protein VTI74DRAFT_7478 [Chaetomium olivicolor]